LFFSFGCFALASFSSRKPQAKLSFGFNCGCWVLDKLLVIIFEEVGLFYLFRSKQLVFFICINSFTSLHDVVVGVVDMSGGPGENYLIFS